MSAALLRPLRVVIAAAGLAAAVQGVHAQPANMTAGEVALTHPVCEDAQGMPAGWVQHFRHSPRAPYWESVMGKTFWAVHHYCWALIHLQRAARPGLPKPERDHMIRVAIRDFYYVINEARQNSEAQFVLLPELHYRAGESYILLQEYPQAMAEFELSRRAKPDYWPPYVAQAQLHARLGMRAQARQLVEAGLQVMPDEPNLREAMRRIGGTAPSSNAAPRPQAAGSSPAAPPR